MSFYKGYYIDHSEVHIHGKFIVKKRKSQEIVWLTESVGEACMLIEQAETQTSFSFPDPTDQEIYNELLKSNTQKEA